MHRLSADDRALGVYAIVPLVLSQRFQCQDYESCSDIIVRVQSTACNHGPVSRGCMKMQSTTRHSTTRGDSMSPINRLRI